MNTAIKPVVNVLVASLGSPLLDFVWQGALIGLACAALLSAMRHARPQIRYAVACSALVLCILFPLYGVIQSVIKLSGSNLSDVALNDLATQNVDGDVYSQMVNWAHLHLASLVFVWSIGVALLSVRLITGLLWVSSVKRSDRGSLHPHWQTQLNGLALNAGITKAIKLQVVDGLTSPAVAGWLQPAVLMPAALITGMPTDMLRALLAHEVAHIRRRDFLVNLLQRSVEILLFYHPAVWWMSKQIRVERELIADNIAVQLTGDPFCLAAALSELDKVQRQHSELAMAANGGKLIDRINLLIRPPTQSARPIMIAPVLSVLLVGFALVASAMPRSGEDAVVAENSAASISNMQNCKPDYPAVSLAHGEQGTVHLVFVINASGQVAQSKIEQSSGFEMLDEAAERAFQQCQYHPATRNGNPVESRFKLTYVWTIQ
jgi:D-alanyl-D-alanine endopeptidase (penicillin-binding protein 7)